MPRRPAVRCSAGQRQRYARLAPRGAIGGKLLPSTRDSDSCPWAEVRVARALPSASRLEALASRSARQLKATRKIRVAFHCGMPLLSMIEPTG
jgi:hypothetical protein